MKQRITAGPIEDLEVGESIQRIGYVAMRPLSTSNTSLFVNIIEGEEIIRDLPNCKVDGIPQTVQGYLERIEGYLAHATSTNSGFFGFTPQQMTGDLYKKIK